MMSAWTAATLLTYAIQVAVLVAVGAVLPRVFRLAAPRARFVYFYAVLAACLLLPFVQPWHAGPVRGAAPTVTELPLDLPAGGMTGAPRASQAPPARWPPLPLPSLGLTLLILGAAGAAGRLAWLALGVRGLQQLRRTAAPLEGESHGVAEAVALAGIGADLRATPDVAAPVTFGARHPVVLLPADFATFDEAQQKAIVCHELLHVKRHDWLATLGEEVFRSLAWFHPAIWWLIDQIQLAREQVVDAEVVRLIRGRDAYLDALLRLVAPAPQPALRPASLFLRKAHLAQRIALLLKEGPMSARRLALSLSAIAVVLLAGGVLMVQALPLRTASPAAAVQQQVPPPGGAAGGVVGGMVSWPHVSHQVTPAYPPEVLQKGIGGSVYVLVQIEQDGRVSAARLSPTRSREDTDNPLLIQAALAAALQFRFDPLPTAREGFGLRFNFRAADGTVAFVPSRPPPPPPPAPTRTPALAPPATATTQRQLPAPDPETESRLIFERQSHPTDPKVYEQLVGFYNRQGNFDKVIETYREWAAIQPANAEVYYSIASYCWDEAYRNAGSDARRQELVQAGLEADDQALALRPDYVDALVRKGLLLRLKAAGETDRARYAALMREAQDLQARAKTLLSQNPGRGVPAPVSGSVVDQSGKGLPGVLVAITIDGVPEAQAITDDQGRFAMTVRAPSTCAITASLAGYRMPAAPTLTVISGTPTNVRLVLQR